MERRDIILMAVFGTIGGLAVLVVLGLAAWLYLRARKSKERDDHLGERNELKGSFSDDRGGKSTKKNGLLSSKTPLISTKSFG